MTGRRARASGWRVLRAPAALAALSTAGLATSLLGDGAWDLAGAGLLVVPALLGLARLGPERRPPRAAARYAIRRRSLT